MAPAANLQSEDFPHVQGRPRCCAGRVDRTAWPAPSGWGYKRIHGSCSGSTTTSAHRQSASSANRCASVHRVTQTPTCTGGNSCKFRPRRGWPALLHIDCAGRSTFAATTSSLSPRSTPATSTFSAPLKPRRPWTTQQSRSLLADLAHGPDPSTIWCVTAPANSPPRSAPSQPTAESTF